MTGGTKAQLFTLDLLLALVPLTIALGMSANAMSGVATQVQDYADTYSDRRIANDAMDALVKTAGVPVDWESNISSIQMVGVAAWDRDNNKVISNYVDAWKLYLLNNSNVTPKLEQLFGTTNYNLTLFVHNISAYNISNFTLPSVGLPVPSNASEIIAVERILVTDNLLRIRGRAPEGLIGINNSKRQDGGGGGAMTRCIDSELTLSNAEIQNTNFWFYMNFTPSPKTMRVRFNQGCERQPKCNQILSSRDFPIATTFTTLPGWNYVEQDDCAGGGVTQNVSYWVEKTGDTWVMYVKVPSGWLVADTQVIYIWLNGATTFESGWIAYAPVEVTIEQLEDYFRSEIPLDDVPCKLLLRVWE